MRVPTPFTTLNELVEVAGSRWEAVFAVCVCLSKQNVGDATEGREEEEEREELAVRRKSRGSAVRLQIRTPEWNVTTRAPPLTEMSTCNR